VPHGGAIKDTYDDGTNSLHGKQPPNAPLRASKGSHYEGGHRVPFIARWPGHIAKESVSGSLMGHMDALASFAALTNQKLEASAGPDSYNVLLAWLGQKLPQPSHDHLVLQTNNPSPLALREGDWMLIEKGAGKKNAAAGPNPELSGYELYNLATDIGETDNLAAKETARAKAMIERLKSIRENGRSRK